MSRSLALLILGGVGVLILPGFGLATLNSAVSASSSAAATSTTSGSGIAAALQQQFIDVVNLVRPSVVEITTTSGLGSGVVYDTKGDIVTNDHVVGQARSFQVQLSNGGQSRTASLVGAYPPDDLAVIRMNNPPSLRAARIGNSNALQVGDIVLAIGNPLGLSSSVTEGIVSATNRTVVEPQGASSPGGTIANAVQISAPINPGNSGGALVDLSGSVVGIPTLAAEDPQIGGAAVGIGFAIPASTVSDIAGQIIANGHVVNSHRAALGIYAFDATNALGQPVGVGVQRLVSGGPAAQAGITVGSLITSVAGKATPDVSSLDAALAQLSPGRTVQVQVVRPGGKTATVNVKLGTLAGNTG